ncbi:pre-mRNA-splicing factor SPP2 [Stagonosporopsis vannaccii]|nr:pre-mRNA-splicing factor SPP2 [Stagonosporopsis vannaccii]
MAAGGFKMSLGGLKAKPGLKAVAAKNNTKPKKALLGDDEPDDTNKAQEIAGFDAAEGGAIDVNGPKEKKGPLVIPSLPNRNWREEARRKQLERAPHTQQQQNGDVVMDEPEKEVVYGLTVPSKPSEAAEPKTTQAPEAMDVDPNDDLTDAQRLEKQALESLLTGKATDTQRVVPAISDEEALRNDLLDAPDEPDVAAYEATPIEGFGLAMLRGMGWKDSDGEARKGGAAKAPAEVKRRPALLGIGAKADAAKDVELGEFNSKARGKKGRDAPQGYNPVTLRNKKTGEVVSEEELKMRLESQEMLGEEGSAGKEERRDDRDRRSDRDRRDESGRDSDRRRDRTTKEDRRRDKYDSDSERRRDRRRDRERSADHDSDRRRERRRDRDTRDRSRSRSPRESKRRDRYRSRSRDDKERRERRRSRSRDRDSDEERRRRRRRREREGERDGDERRRDRDRDRDRGDRRR